MADFWNQFPLVQSQSGGIAPPPTSQASAGSTSDFWNQFPLVERQPSPPQEAPRPSAKANVYVDPGSGAFYPMEDSGPSGMNGVGQALASGGRFLGGAA